MRKPQTLLTVSAALFSLIGGVLADTAILNNGEKVEGKVLRETDTEVVLEVRMSATIKDERVIKKTDLKELQKIQPDIEAWAELKGLTLSEESGEANDYTGSIERFKNFVSSFPQSANAAEAKTRLAAFEAERKRVEGGEIKLEGKWLSKDEVEQERVQIDGRVMLRRMQRFAAAGQFPEAMNTFDALEKRAGGSASFPPAVLLARQTVNALKTAVEQQKALLKSRMEEGKRRLANVTGPDKQQLEAAQKNHAQQVEAAVAAYERSGAKWLPLNPATDRSLTTLASKVASETGSLSRYNVDKMKESIAASDKARAALAANDATAADEALKLASNAWSTNEFVKRLQPQIVLAKAKAVSDKSAADKLAAQEAKDAAAAKVKAAAVATSKHEEAAVVAEVVKNEQTPLFAKPVFWVILLALVGLVAGGMQMAKKRRQSAELGGE